MSALNPCPSCNRHVRADETACPFCAAALPSRASLPERVLPRGRLSRAALIAAGATLAGLSACSSSTSGSDAGTGGTTAAAGSSGGGTSGGGTNGAAGGGGGSASAGTSGSGGQVSVAIYSAAFPPGGVPKP